MVIKTIETSPGNEERLYVWDFRLEVTTDINISEEEILEILNKRLKGLKYDISLPINDIEDF